MGKEKECRLGKMLAETFGCNGRKLRPEKRQAIIGAAIMEIERRGFQGASMDRIALRARVSKRTVYNHFGSKEDLIKAIVREHAQQATDTVRLTYDPAHPLREQLMELGRREIDFLHLTLQPGLTRALLAECIRTPGLAARVLEGLATKESGVAEWIDAAAANGKLRTDQPEFAARQFVALLKGQLFWPQLIGSADGPDSETIEHALTETVDMFLARYAVQ